MKKIIFLILLVLVIPFVFSGCGMEKSENYTTVNEVRFVLVETYNQGDVGFRIIVDKETRIMYLSQISKRGERYDGLCVLLDADGNPQKYQGEL